MSSTPHRLDIPLFPLPNVVLFPGVILPLHIFEERYKLMINGCIDNESVFGVVLLKEDSESPATIHRVGVTARVTRVERLDEGRMNILSEGRDRFRILDFNRKNPYWTGTIEVFSDEEQPEETLAPLYRRVADLYSRAFQLGLEIGGEKQAEPEIPASPAELSFLVSYVLNLDPEDKQQLLEMTLTSERLTVLVDHLKATVERLEHQLTLKGKIEKVRGNGDLGMPSKS